MNHELWKSTAARVVALAFVVGAAAACDRGHRDEVRQPAAASPSAVVIGTAPAEPKGDTPETTAPAGAQSTVSKAAESNSRPLEGDNHSYSTVAPTTPQKADGQNTTGGGEGTSR